MAHTSGPWKQGTTLVTAATSHWNIDQWKENEERENRMVFANFSFMDQGLSRVRIAVCEKSDDALLIAAAPELLEALEEFLKAYDSDKLFGDDPSEVDKARAAIRKAKGEQS